ncbi:MAG: SlyX family protein [Cephaloticoccus sp.]|nr:SlyX family protein [Cephaloticoccus sp.]MCF7761393.1 SlyX family protein [Cephaloticoccus sp.]
MSDALQRLEEKIAYLERHVVEQDKAMLELSDILNRLKLELTGMRQRLTEPAHQSDDSIAPLDERPPHY